MSASDKACEVCGCVCYMSHLYRIEDMWDRPLNLYMSLILCSSHMYKYERPCVGCLSHMCNIGHPTSKTSYIVDVRHDLLHCTCESWCRILYMWDMRPLRCTIHNVACIMTQRGSLVVYGTQAWCLPYSYSVTCTIHNVQYKRSCLPYTSCVVLDVWDM